MPDPTAGTVGGYRILRVIGSGGQGVVYLGESPDGRRVAIKTLHMPPDAEEAARFLREASVLPRVASFCAARVLDTGVEGGMPYIVSEYIDGPTLLARAAQRPFAGRELHRLAVGTVTALAAIHKAGVTHRDFKPANVLLSGDGPRVIDFGIAVTAASDTTRRDAAGTPAYMAPEQFAGEPVGPAADMFAWASTMVYAATGRAPFGHDSVPAIMRRVIGGEPDLGAFPEGELREIVLACLAKDPAERPTASQVLLRLLGLPEHTAARPLPDHVLATGKGVADAGTRSPRRRWLAVGAAVAVLALGATATAMIVGREPPAPVRPSPSFKGSGPPDPNTTPLAVPELRATFYESPSDPVRLSAFVVRQGMIRPAYVRVPGTARFERLPEYREPVVSPDGRTVASVFSFPQFAPDSRGTVQLTDRATGRSFLVPTVAKPLLVKRPAWSPDGGRVLVTVTDAEDRTRGFVVVDVRGRTATPLAEVTGLPEGAVEFAWTQTGREVYVSLGDQPDGVAVLSLDGRPLRTVRGIRTTTGTTASFSPSGARLAGLCPGKRFDACVVDPATGRRLARFPLPEKGNLWNWFNEDHLLVYSTPSTRWSVDVVDLSGKPVRPFARMTGDAETWWRLMWGPS
ncbi:protein kinase domain-containing protein [Thermoactinospora rubra]|uniref:protein kinase domain-containing protein n=1 Tax=Thermoactinospora rubra TaxID=1088767 RepID=UPI000A0FDE7B|nr:protein kinase [Thermoactinospora rubra]